MDIDEEKIERDLKSAERTMIKLKRLKREIDIRKSRKNLPSFLQGSKAKWAKIIASGIITGILGRCCNTGCPHCNFIGWRRIKPGNIINIDPPIFSTGEYGKEQGVTYKTIARKCDEGLLISFRIPGSQTRYVIGELDDFEL